ASGVRHIADLMRYVPGIVVGDNDGNHPVVSMHGMSGTYASGVQVLVDGVSVYSPLWGGMEWEELPLALNDIERIEVIRGPNAALFGANSFAGVINIITRHPAAEPGWRVSGNVGNGGTADGSVSHAGSLENGLQYRATVGQRASDGYASRPDTQRQYYGNVRAEYQVDATDSVHFSGRIADNRKDNGDYTVTDGSSRIPHPNQSNLLDFQLRWSRAFSADNEWWVQVYHQQSKTSDTVTIDYKQTTLGGRLFSLLNPFLAGLVPGPVPITVDSGYETRRDGIEFQQTLRWSPDLRSVWGVESRRDAAASPTYLGSYGQQSVLLLRAYGNIEWRFAKDWTLNFADMLEKDTAARTEWSPKMAMTWQPIQGHVFRAAISTAQRTPSIYEERNKTGYPVPLAVQAGILAIPGAQAALAAFGVNDISRITLINSSGQIDNEHLRVEELGYSFELPEWNFGGDARWAWEHHRGLSATVGSFPNVDIVNKNRVEVEAGDLTLRWKPVDGTLLRLALARLTVKSSTAPSSYNASAPENTVSFLWDQHLPSNWRASANYQRVSAMHWLDAGNGLLGNPALPPIENLNLRLGKRLLLPGFADSEIAVVMQNALGKHREYFAGFAVNQTSDTVASRVTFLQFNGQF
ncbi:MAG: hypothetical protein EKK46_07590, partial [Rhodocyclaceae bacterium]